jgi:hypothetical protein
MNRMSKQELYKHKANKYYLKYVQCKKIQKGGSIIKPIWLDVFLEEINQVYDSNYVITGSGAVALYLNYYNQISGGRFNDLISNMRIPNDIDFVYYCKGSEYESRKKIGKFTRFQDPPQRSVTYEFNSLGSFPSIIKSFDLTCLAKIAYSRIDEYKVLSLDKLLDFYSEELTDKKMIIDSYSDRIREIEEKMEEAKINKKVGEFLDLESEYYEMISSFDKANNKIASLESKINIIDILIRDIKINSKLTEHYQLNYIPEISITPKKEVSSTRNLFYSDVIKKLFDEDNGASDEDIEKMDVVSKNDFKPKSLFVSSPDTTTTFKMDKKSSMSTPSPRKLSFDDSDSSNLRFRRIPYKIKFDFEEEV